MTYTLSWVAPTAPPTSYVTRSGNTGLIHTLTENPVFVHKLKVHSCNTQKHQVLGNRWPRLLLQMAFC